MMMNSFLPMLMSILLIANHEVRVGASPGTTRMSGDRLPQGAPPLSAGSNLRQNNVDDTLLDPEVMAELASSSSSKARSVGTVDSNSVSDTKISAVKNRFLAKLAAVNIVPSLKKTVGRVVSPLDATNFRQMVLHQSGMDWDILLPALFRPTRLLRSVLWSWVVSELFWGKRRYFSNFLARRKPRKKSSGNGIKRYRRVQKNIDWMKRKTIKYQGIIPPDIPPDENEEEALDRQRNIRHMPRVRGRIGRTDEQVFDNIIPESQRTTNMLSKADKGRIIQNYEQQPTKRPRNKPPRRRQKQTKTWVTGVLRLTRQKKMALVWGCGHFLSPVLWLATSLGGWAAVLWLGSEVLTYLELDGNNEVIGLLTEPFRSDLARAMLFGSIVGGAAL